jgi:hypothetical protein
MEVFMKDYIVVIEETLVRKVEIKASSEEMALDAIKELYNNAEIVLDSSDYETTEFSVENGDKNE